jgi:hypothetical protein
MATQFTEGAAYSCVFVTLGVFALTAAAGAFHDRRKLRDRDEYFSARNSQSTFSLAMTYFASGIGGWVFYSVSEVGTYAGSLGIIGCAPVCGARSSIQRVALSTLRNTRPRTTSRGRADAALAMRVVSRPSGTPRQ